MEITKVVKPFITRGWPNTFGNIVYFYTYMVKLVMYAAVGMWNWKTPWVAAECLLSMLHDTAVKA